MLLIKYVLILIGWGGLKMIDHGDYRGLVFFFGAVALWNWRWCLEFVQDRRWREDFRDW
jgi:hypothetical protein